MSFFAKLGGSDSESSSDEEELEMMSDSDSDNEQPKAPKGKASMFLRSDDDSDDDSDEESDEDDDDSDDGSDVGRALIWENLANKFLRGAASSDEEDSDEEDKTVVLSAKDKRFVEMDQAIKMIQDKTKINDWVSASSELDKLITFITRHQVAMSASPIPPSGHIPPSFLQVLVDLDENVTAKLAAEKKATKKMAAGQAKAVNSIRQTLKKKVKEFELVLATYKEDPEAYAAAYTKANAAPKVVKAPKKAAADQEEGEVDGDFQTIGKGGKTLNLTAEGTYKTLREIFESRGKKNTDRAETIRILTKLLEVTETTYQKIRVLLALVPARLDYSQALPSIPHESWVLGMHEMEQLVTILLEEPDYVVTENPGEYDDMVEREPKEVDGKKERVAIAGNVISLLENLDNEFTKTLQHTDAHEKGAEYIARLREEAPLYALITKAQALFERENATDNVVRAVMRRVEHLYAKPDNVIEHFQTFTTPRMQGLVSRVTPFDSPLSPSTLIRLLCVKIYNSDAPLLRARAILCHIFNHATKGRYHQARDLLLMSHLQDSIAQADVTTQILYNRAVMQLGLSAFRLGYITECQTILADMFSTQRQKELLAQAIQRYGNAITPEQELIEKRRLLPFHMHLNIELLEAAYLTSCMLIEVPLLAAAETEEQKRRIASKQFKRLLDQADKQAFMGPPENTRDHIIKASKALSVGEWERAVELIQTVKIWTLLDNAEDVKVILAKKIQEEGLRTYLFTYASHYASLSLSHLSSTFSLSLPAVVSIISRMIYNEEIAAALDQIDGVVLFHTVETNEVQRLALQLADRVANLVENNEKLLDQKLGNQTGPAGAGDRAEGQQRGGPGRERRGGARGGRGGRGGRGRGGFNSGLGGVQRRVQA